MCQSFSGVRLTTCRCDSKQRGSWGWQVQHALATQAEGQLGVGTSYKGTGAKAER
jgi:hypothetical protein